MTVSVGGEIGEVGHKNSTVEELHAFMLGLQPAAAAGKLVGMSKISVQTGTSHGGVVLPDGTMADVKLDLAALEALSTGRPGLRNGGRGAARGQHPAVQRLRQLPPDRDGGDPPGHQFPEHRLRPPEAAGRSPQPDLRLARRERPGGEESGRHRRSSSITGRASGPSVPFKREMWDLPEATRQRIAADLEQTFGFLFDQLGIAETAALVREHVTAPVQHHAMLAKVGAAADDPDAGE